MLWQPLNLSDVCPPNAHMDSCTLFGYVYLNLLVKLYGGSRDKVSPETPRQEYDFIVVGAGSAGCVVANRLTENPNWKVLLLEAGGRQPDVTLSPALSTALLGSNIDWNYSTEPNGKSCLAHRNQRCPMPRGKVLGGSSTINSMSYVRGNRVDYNLWHDLGNPGWSYHDVLPFFKKSERNVNIEALDAVYHGVQGEQFVARYPYIDTPPLMLTEGYTEGGAPLRDFNGAFQEGNNQAQAFSVQGERVSTNTAFLQPIIEKRPNLVVKIESEVVKILIDDKNRAYGVDYIQNGKKYTVYAKREVIVSGGSINTPKLMMLSGIGPKEHLQDLGIPVKKDLPVGRNLHDHVTFNGMLLALPNRTSTLVSNEEILQAVVDYHDMDIKGGPMSANGPVNSICFIKSQPDLIAPDLQFQVDNIHNWRQYIEDPILYEEVAFLPTAFYDAVVIRPMNLVPKSRGYVLLNATDPHGAPLIQPNYFADRRDLIPLLYAVEFLLSLEKTPAYRARGAYYVREPLPACRDYEWGTEAYYICLAKEYTSTTYHPVGTCKMGPKEDAEAVVDSELRVYGVKYLRVIDASIMPVIIRGNTNAPTMMIAERGVDFVIRHWNKILSKQNDEDKSLLELIKET
ncbi:glucose dehydrogenase [FAD, quinone]-like [Danaus plexippus]|uniref:glucose dehydrogenase [FAD, quinone]-like n=1 Tax=Danaus plexippus TaxID=13037 RepID=UPI002AB209A8|nr:glucose dehydrogenase [FAD, quinone]-like [Danaus plexippus]